MGNQQKKKREREERKVEGSGRKRKKKKSAHIYFKHFATKIASWVWMKILGPHLVQPRPPASTG